jgi:hypothetical protein
VPNLKTDRIGWVARGRFALNVRRLMYQSLIWAVHPSYQSRSLRTSLDAQDVERTSDSLVNRMRGNPEFNGDFLGRKMLIDQKQRVELSLAQPADTGDESRIRLAGG